MLVPGNDSINRITAVANPVLRNLLITQCYAELSAAFAERMKGGANWCTFATWASKQAGQTIRQEDLKDKIENWINDDPSINAALILVATFARRSGATQLLDQLRKSAFATMATAVALRASEAVSRGNLKVFDEIAREFSRFLNGCFRDKSYDASHIDAFCIELKTGPPPEGQEYLQQAFRYYYQALFEDAVDDRTQLNLLANLLVGFHEQNRLQPEIFEALNAPGSGMQQFRDELIKNLFLGSNTWTKVRLFFKKLFGRSLLDNALDQLQEKVQSRIRIMLTHHLMTLTLPPANCLLLSQDLLNEYPAGLKKLVHPRLLQLLQTVDPVQGSGKGSGATDWTSLPERMHYIAELFRCYHGSTDLFAAAFTPDQAEALINGRMPEGNL